MNYLKEILVFENWLEYNSAINKSDIRLWYTLMYAANRFNWKEFTIAISTLIFKSKLSKSEIYRSRNKLKQFGLIDFKERPGNQSTIYKINSCVDLFGTQIGTQSGTPSGTQSGNINKTKNINKNKTKKEINKEKFVEFENVFLSEQEFEKLKARFKNEAEVYIERLSNYIESSGKRYKSHYATILSWAEKDKQIENLRGESYEKFGQHRPKKLCTEYPE